MSEFSRKNLLMCQAADISEDRQIELQRIVDDFIKSDEIDINLPNSLTSQERLFVHQIAEKANLKHHSKGSGPNRQLTLSKQVNCDSYFVNVAIDQKVLKPLSLSIDSLDPCNMRNECKLQFNFKKGVKGQSMNGDSMHSSVSLMSSIPPHPLIDPEMAKFRNRLPIHSYRDTILDTIGKNQVSLVAADTGAGKTTQVPQYLLEWHSAHSIPCLILCSQPRRLAAISSADRIARERNEVIGHTVGYCMKHESRLSDKLTRLLFCTTGTLLRMLIMDSTLLHRVTHLIIDEVHERDRFTDFLLCVIKRFCETNNRLSIVLMSASMNEQLLSQYFNKCPVIRVPGRMFPVQQLFLEHILVSLKESSTKETNELDFTMELDMNREEFQTVALGKGEVNVANETSLESGGSLASHANCKEPAPQLAVSDAATNPIVGMVESSPRALLTEREILNDCDDEIEVELIDDLIHIVVDDSCGRDAGGDSGSSKDQESAPTGESVELSLNDVDNLLLLFFHTKSMDSFSFILKLIKSCAIPVDYQHSESGMTVLMIACTHGDVDIVNSLLQLGACPQLADFEGKTASDYAVHNHHFNVEHILNAYSRLIEEPEDESKAEQGAQLVDEYVRAYSADTESVDTELILQVILYITSNTFTNLRDKDDRGAILVFLPGYEEITQMKLLLESHEVLGDVSKYKLFVLHSNVNTNDQKRVFDFCPQRKIILSTNIAETSLTIDDVTFVVDPGKTKEREIDTQSSLSYSLQVCWASKANVKQRAGRAGRTKPGYAFHLFSKTRYESMKEFSMPEILRYPLNDLCLQTKIVFPTFLSIKDILCSVPDPPSESLVSTAVSHLKDIGALDSEENLTTVGSFLVKVPLEPDLSRMVLYSLLFRCLDPVCILAATLAYRSPFFIPPSRRLVEENDKRKKKLSLNSQSDHFTLIFAFLTWYTFMVNGKKAKADEFCRLFNLSAPVLEVINKTRLQILRHLVSCNIIKSPKSFVYFNSNSHLTSCIRASVFGAFSHSTVLYDATRAKYCSDWSNNLKVHKSSAVLNNNYSPAPCCLCCDEISRGGVGQPMIKCATAVHPLLILLLSNKVASIESATDDFSLFKISATIKLTCKTDLAHMILTARKVIQHCIISMVEGAFVDTEFQGVIDSLIGIMESLEPSDIGFTPKYQNHFMFAQQELFPNSQNHHAQSQPPNGYSAEQFPVQQHHYNYRESNSSKHQNHNHHFDQFSSKSNNKPNRGHMHVAGFQRGINFQR